MHGQSYFSNNNQSNFVDNLNNTSLRFSNSGLLASDQTFSPSEKMNIGSPLSLNENNLNQSQSQTNHSLATYLPSLLFGENNSNNIYQPQSQNIRPILHDTTNQYLNFPHFSTPFSSQDSHVTLNRSISHSYKPSSLSHSSINPYKNGPPVFDMWETDKLTTVDHVSVSNSRIPDCSLSSFQTLNKSSAWNISEEIGSSFRDQYETGQSAIFSNSNTILTREQLELSCQRREGSISTNFNASSNRNVKQVDCWITVFGFEPDMVDEVLKEFQSIDTIVDHILVPNSNWMHICFSTNIAARKALGRNSKIILKRVMIGVSMFRADLYNLNDANENFHPINNNVTEILSRKPSIRKLGRDTGANSLEKSQSADDSLIGKAFKYVFGASKT